MLGCDLSFHYLEGLSPKNRGVWCLKPAFRWIFAESRRLLVKGGVYWDFRRVGLVSGTENLKTPKYYKRKEKKYGHILWWSREKSK